QPRFLRAVKRHQYGAASHRPCADVRHGVRHAADPAVERNGVLGRVHCETALRVHRRLLSGRLVNSGVSSEKSKVLSDTALKELSQAEERTLIRRLQMRASPGQ